MGLKAFTESLLDSVALGHSSHLIKSLCMSEMSVFKLIKSNATFRIIRTIISLN